MASSSDSFSFAIFLASQRPALSKKREVILPHKTRVLFIITSVSAWEMRKNATTLSTIRTKPRIEPSAASGRNQEMEQEVMKETKKRRRKAKHIFVAFVFFCSKSARAAKIFFISCSHRGTETQRRM